MRNVEMKVEAGKLHIIVDLSAAGEPSASQKTIVIGTTQGNVPAPDTDVIVGLNVYRYAKKKGA